VSDTALAIALALASTLGYGASFVLTQFGLQRMPPWLGAAFSVPTATLLFWCMAPFAIDTATMDFGAIALFAGIGLFVPASVTLLNFESNRLMGANIAGTLAGLTPVFAVGLALYLLGERPRLSQWLALAAIAGGVMLMGRRRQQNFPHPRYGYCSCRSPLRRSAAACSRSSSSPCATGRARSPPS